MPASKESECSLCLHQTSRRLTRFLLHRPAGAIDQPQKLWPLLLFLHGSGERGTRIGAVTKHGPPRLARTEPGLPFIVVSPQCPAGETWENQPLIPLLDFLLETEPVDPTRVYGTGISMGGYGIWDLALKHPGRFAAMVPICGGGSLLSALLQPAEKSRAMRSLPIRAFHGGRDDVVPPAESERMVEACRRIGSKCDLIIYPEDGHDCWTRAYSEGGVFDWLLQHRRRAKTSHR